jgi:hypothetical protein
MFIRKRGFRFRAGFDSYLGNIVNIGTDPERQFSQPKRKRTVHMIQMFNGTILLTPDWILERDLRWVCMQIDQCAFPVHYIHTLHTHILSAVKHHVL